MWLKQWATADLISHYGDPKGSCSKVEACLFSQVTNDDREWPKFAPGDVQIGYWETFLDEEGCQPLEQAAQASG